MRFAWIATEKATYPLRVICRVLRVTPSGFYAWQRRPLSAHARRDGELDVRIRALFTKARQRYGSPRIHDDLREAGVPVSRKRVARLMRQSGLRARQRKRYRSTTMSEHDQPIAPSVTRSHPAPLNPPPVLQFTGQRTQECHELLFFTRREPQRAHLSV